MGYARYVGRVGALAVVLGVGSALGSPAGVVWADTGGSAETQSSQSTTTTAPADAAPGGSTTAAAEDGGGQVTGGDTATPSPAPRESSTEGSGTTSTQLPDSPTVVIDAQTNGSTEQVDEARPGAQQEVDVADVRGTEDTASDATLVGAIERAVTPEHSGSKESQTAAPTAQADDAHVAVTDPGRVGQSGAEVAGLAITAANVNDEPAVRSAAHPTAAVDPQPQPAQPSVTVELSQPAPGPLSAVVAPFRAVVLGVLGVFGYNPDPTSPSSNPILDAVWGFYRRIESLLANQAPQAGTSTFGVSVDQAGQTVLNGQLSFTDPDFDPLAYSITAGDATVDQNGKITLVVTDIARPITFTVAVSDGSSSLLGAASTTTAKYTIVLNPGTAPAIVTVTPPGQPQSSGQVTGSVIARDPGGAPLHGEFPGVTSVGGRVTFAAPTQDASGDWTISYTYTPDLEARYKAFEGTGPTTDTFAITVSNGQSVTVTPHIVVQIAPLQRPILTPPVILSVPAPNLPDTGGLVRGSVIAQDPSGAPLHGEFPGLITSLGGRVDFDQPTQVNGDWTIRYTYTPDLEARYRAFEGTGPTVDTIAITVSNGQSVTVTPQITVKIAGVARPAQGGQIPMPDGYSTGTPVSFDPHTGVGYLTVRGPQGPRVIVVRPNGSTVTTDALPGTVAAQVVDPSTGVAYVLSLTQGSSGAPSTSWISVVRPDGSLTAPQEVAGLPLAGLPVLGGGVAYLTTADASSGTRVGRITVVRPDGTLAATRTLPGQVVGGLAVIDPITGVAYQSSYSPGTGQAWVSVVRPDGSLITDPDPLPGQAFSAPVVDPNTGLAYQLTFETIDKVWVTILGSDGQANPPQQVPGQIAGLPVIAGDAGAAYVVTKSATGTLMVSVVRPDGLPINTVSLPGQAGGPQFFAPAVDPTTGIAYITVKDATGALRVSLVHPDGSVMTTDPLNGGQQGGQIVVSADQGLTYHVSFDTAANTPGATWISLVRADGSVVTTDQLPGGAPSSTFGGTGGVVVDSTHGVTYVTTRDVRGTMAGTSTTWISVIGTDGTVIATRELQGNDPVGGVVVDADSGVAFQTTSAVVAGAAVTLIHAVRPDGSLVTVTADPLPGSPILGVVIDPLTGAVYQSTSTATWSLGSSPAV